VLRRWLLLGLVISGRALANTWYLSPTGSDSAAGTRDAPFLTVQHAATVAIPGDAIVLLDGVYPPFEVNCQTGAPAGNAARPFVVKADHERQAVVQSDGLTPTLAVVGCAYWNFEGLHLKSTDAAGTTHSGALISQTSNIVLRRMVLSHANRQIPDDELLRLDRTRVTLVEDCELYAFHSAAVRISGGNADVLRRDYFQSRNWSTGTPPTSISLAPCTACIVENSISEGNGQLVDLPGGTSSQSLHNRMVGSISIGDQQGLRTVAYAGPVNAPDDTDVRDFVAVGPGIALQSAGVSGVRCIQCSSFDGLDGFSIDYYQTPDGGTLQAGDLDFAVVDTLAVGARFAGISFAERAYPDAGAEFTNAWNNGFNYIPELNKYPDAGFRLSEDPMFGACKVFVPATSPMKGAGSGGADIGANILFRSVDAGLTPQPLWDPVTGAFPCGALVPGLNDVPDASCFDVHVRLDVNTPACPLPGRVDAGIDAGTPDAGSVPVSAYGLRCDAGGGATAFPALALVLWRRKRRLSPSS
jgi:hypothetical protein